MSSAALRVAHVVATAGRSGVESHLRALLPSFDPSEVQARLFVPGDGPLVAALAEQGFRAERGAPSHKVAWGETAALALQLRDTCDVLHAHGPRAAFWSAIAVRQARIPRFVCTVHELRWRSLPPGPQRALWVALEVWAMRQAHRLLVFSQDSEARVRERFPDLAPKLVRVPGSTPLLMDPRADRLACADESGNPVRVIAIGRLEWVKRHDRLLEAVALARAKGANVELHLAGDGPLAPMLRERANALDIGSRVHWAGPSFNVPALLASGHLFATASESETFGIAALEAMVVGLPVLTTENGGVSELVAGARCGEVVRASPEREIVHALADGIAALAASPARRAELGAAAAAYARERHSPAAMARATLAAYRA